MLNFFLLQVPASPIDKHVPDVSELMKSFGPTLGLVISIVLLFLTLFLLAQAYWFNKRMKDRNREIDRLVQREEVLNERYMKVLDELTAQKK